VLSISVRDSAAMLDAIHGPEPSSLYVAPPPEAFRQEVGRDPGRMRIAFTDKSPYGDTIDPEIAAAVREVASLLAGLGHHVEERAPVLAADPAAVMSTIVSANTALNVRVAEQRFGRTMTDSDFEILTLASAHNAQKATATDYVEAQLSAFQISRDWRRSFRAAMYSCARRFARHRCGSANSTRCRKICRISRRSCGAICTTAHVQHVRPARDVDAAGMECGRIAARHDVRRTLWR